MDTNATLLVHPVLNISIHSHLNKRFFADINRKDHSRALYIWTGFHKTASAHFNTEPMKSLDYGDYPTNGITHRGPRFC